MVIIANGEKNIQKINQVTEFATSLGLNVSVYDSIYRAVWHEEAEMYFDSNYYHDMVWPGRDDILDRAANIIDDSINEMIDEELVESACEEAIREYRANTLHRR